jgi:methanogenic corrinoid protein MtbC1
MEQVSETDTSVNFKQIFEKLDPAERKTKVICTLG